MIIFRLNQKFDRVDEIREYHSLIWTERWGSSGDFEMHIPYRISDADFKPGNVIETSDNTMSPMLIETISRSYNNGQRDSLVIKGRSLDILASNIYYNKQFLLKAPVEGLARAAFLRATNYDQFGVTYARELDLNMFSTSIQSENSEYMEYITRTDTSVYEQVVDLLKISNGGYKISRNFNKPEGEIHGAYHITFAKTNSNDSVAFIPSMGDFDSFTSIESISNYRNVIGKKTLTPSGEELYSYGILPTTNGAAFDREYNRRMAFLDLTSVLNPSDFVDSQSYWNAIVTEEKKELAKHRYTKAFEGRVSSKLRFKYGVDYNIGDVIKVYNENTSYNVLVSEFIRSYTKDGYEEYPTIISI